MKNKLEIVILLASLTTVSFAHEGKDVASSETASAHESAGTCTLNGLANSCKDFSEDGPKILPNGLPNYAALTKKGARSVDIEKGESQRRERHMKELKAREEVATMLFEVDTRLTEKGKKATSLHFKTFLQTIPPSSVAKFVGAVPRSEIYEDKFMLPWPIDTDEAEFQAVKVEEVQAVLGPLFSDKQKARLRAISEDSKTDVEVAVSGLAAGSDGLKLKDVSLDREKEVSDLVTYAKDKVISLITKGEKDPSKWTLAQNQAVEKINTIKFTGLTSNLRTNLNCSGVIPNAFYRPGDHSFTLCPQLYNMPNETLIGVIAHEIGHAVDPCLSQFGVYKFDAKKYQSELFVEGKPKDEILNNDKRLSALLSLGRGNNKENGYCAAPFPLMQHERETNYFQGKGVISPHVSGTPFSEYVFSSVYQCLKTPAGGGFRSMDPSLIDQVADEMSETLARQNHKAGIPYNANEDRNRIRTAFTQYPECTAPDKHSHMGEAVADWIGSKVTGEYLKGRTLEGDKKVLPVGFFASLACLERSQQEKSTKPEEEAIGDTLRRAGQFLSRLTDPHPETETRIQDIFLRDENIRKAIGCETADGKSCS